MGLEGQKYNPVGLDGVEFLEYTSRKPEKLEQFFEQMGCTKVADHKTKNVSLYRQNRVHYILNKDRSSFAEDFHLSHGPSICATGFRVHDAIKP